MTEEPTEQFSVVAVRADGKRYRRDVTFTSLVHAEMEAEAATVGEQPSGFVAMEVVQRTWKTVKTFKIGEEDRE
jgi:hypothetical protein